MKATNQSISYESLSSLQKSFLIIRNLERKLKDQINRPDSSEEIAVIGMACHLPGGIHTVPDFWNALLAGEDLVTDYGLLTRWQEMEQQEHLFDKCMPHAGLLDDITLFDNDFFHISPAEARYIDPQHRHLLMLAHKAFADAGITADSLKGSDTGVFTGISAFDYSLHVMQQEESLRVNPYICSGNSFSGASGRISYSLGLHGPGISIDTACSSSLVALHQAAASLGRKECNLALVSGANLILSPYLQASLTEAGMLSPDGRCKAFDDSANGYVRSEGCISIVLKRLEDAERDGDRIYACIKGSAVAQDGASGGLTVPNPASQAKVIKSALQAAGVAADEIRFVETHGTGTSLGDPIEAEGLLLAFGERSNREKLVAGSVKSNFGHLEAAAGLAGFMKACLNVYHKQMPPSLHFKTPNHHIDWQQMPFYINTGKYLFNNDTQRIVGGVSSFGFTGTIAHCIVAEYQHPTVEKCISLPDFQLKPHWLGKMPGSLVPGGYAVKWKQLELPAVNVPEKDIVYVYLETDGATPSFQKSFLSGKNAFSIATDHIYRLESIFSTRRYQQFCLVYDISAWTEHDEYDEHTLIAAYQNILSLFQTLKTQSVSPDLILFISSQALHVNATEHLSALQHSLVAFIRSVSLELSSQAILVLDMPDFELPDMNFVNRYVQQSYFREIAFRNGQFYYPVISPAIQVAAKQVTVDKEGTYLVTGGRGSLGEHIAAWLIDNGAARVIISGRSADTNHKNNRIIYKQLDVSSEDEVSAFARWLVSSGLSLKGIVHAAGTNSRCLLKDMTTDDILEVAAPKIKGIRYLSRYLPLDQLDFLLTYSSVAAVWGSAMLSHYAAANAYMDAFVFHLRTKGIPAATINWGPWKNSNMVMKDSNTISLLEETGVLTVDADTVGRNYASLLSMSHDQLIYVRLNKSRFIQLMEMKGTQSFWEVLRGSKQEQQVTVTDTTCPDLMGIADDAERECLINSELILLIQEVLGMPEREVIDPARSFSDMGMDSILLLKFVERINKHLGTKVSSNMIFNYPTIRLLTAHINELSAAPLPVIMKMPVKENRQYSYTEKMSDTELLKLVNNEIQKYS